MQSAALQRPSRGISPLQSKTVFPDQLVSSGMKPHTFVSKPSDFGFATLDASAYSTTLEETVGGSSSNSYAFRDQGFISSDVFRGDSERCSEAPLGSPDSLFGPPLSLPRTLIIVEHNKNTYKIKKLK